MPNVIIPVRHQSAPNTATLAVPDYHQPAGFRGKSRFTKGIEWWYEILSRPYVSPGGIEPPGMVEKLHHVVGKLGHFMLDGGFKESPFDSYELYEVRMDKTIKGVTHDLNVVNQGGDAKGDANLMLDKLMERAAEKQGVDPAPLKKRIQHQDLN